MINTISIFKRTLFVFALGALSNTALVHAQSEDDLGLCPGGFNQGLVTTGYVDCNRNSGQTSDIEEAEFDRLQREAICLANPNSQVQSSEIVANSDSTRFFSRITCRVTRAVAPGTVLCPDDSTEVFRAFDTLACQYFGMASTTAAGAQTMLDEQTTDCLSNFGGRVLLSSVRMETSDTSSGQMVDFFRTSFACAKEIQPLDVFECPLGFDQQRGSNDDMLICEFSERSLETLAEAQALNTQVQEICTGTTAGLGVVSDSNTFASTSGEGFITEMICTVAIPRFGDFADDSVARACDATCTESIVQVRSCLNGGEVGGPGCTLPDTQTIERRCNTGPDRAGLCPVSVVPAANVAPLLLLDDDD